MKADEAAPPTRDAAHRGRRSAEALVERMRQTMREGAMLDQPLDALARALAVSRRTANRRLESQGATFRALRDEVRRELALRLLRDSGMPVAEIAQRLGYRSATNFSRLCKRWFGASPRALRAGLAPWPADAAADPDD